MYRLLPTILLLSASALAQAGRQVVPANFLIPRPPPTAPLADWTSTAGRSTLAETLAGATLRGWDYKASDTGGLPGTPIILFFNGNGMTIDASESLYRMLIQSGAELCVFDYRGIGFSSGTPDILTFRQDALHLYDTIATARPGRPILVYGFSLGTAIASYVASQRKVAGLILAGTFASAQEELPAYSRAVGLSSEIVATLVPAPDSVESFNEIANITRSSAPLLMLHGEADSLVPIAQGREVFAASPSTQKQFVSLPGTTHSQTAGSPESLRALAAFVAAHSTGN